MFSITPLWDHGDQRRRIFRSRRGSAHDPAKLAQKLPSGCIGGEVVGCRAAEHREKANGIDEDRRKGWLVSNICGDAHQYGRADHACEGAHQVYDSVCRELVGSILREPSCSPHLTPILIAHSGAREASIVKTSSFKRLAPEGVTERGQWQPAIRTAKAVNAAGFRRAAPC
jgi:hypothetical protein